jgi:hypothetical protein
MIVGSVRKLASELGTTHTLLNRQRAKGRFSEEPGGGFDVEKVRASLARSADISQPSQANKRTREADDFPAAGGGGGYYQLFNRARAAKEMAIAKERELDLRRRQGELLEAKDVEQAWTKRMIAFNNRLWLISDKVAAKVAVSSDPLECKALIDEEIREAVKMLAQAPEAETDAA